MAMKGRQRGESFGRSESDSLLPVLHLLQETRHLGSSAALGESPSDAVDVFTALELGAVLPVRGRATAGSSLESGKSIP